LLKINNLKNSLKLAYKAANFAVNYRNKFAKDIIVDLICFRKYGHNELDDPTFTNPLLYKSINCHKNVVEIYENILVNEEKIVTREEIKNERKIFFNILNEALENVINSSYIIKPRNTFLNKQWSGMNIASNKLNTKWKTGVNIEFLKEIGIKSVKYPENFVI
jgi:probable 2-oxoglutarate dehydrogenase E1 component DHKTD1